MHHMQSLALLLISMEPVLVVIYWMAMDARMLKASTTPWCLLASRACIFPKDGGISLKVCGEFSMDPTKRFGASARILRF